MTGDNASAPLLGHGGEGTNTSSPGQRLLPGSNVVAGQARAWHRLVAQFLASRKKHFVIMAIVALDVTALLANVFIQLIACEMEQQDEPWVQDVAKSLETIGLIFSCAFMIELALCLFCFGLSYLGSWFHLFDASVIVLSFVIDVASQGLTESIGSLIVVLRLWRLAKISEEVVMGAAERMEILEQQMDELEHENHELRSQLGLEGRN